MLNGAATGLRDSTQYIYLEVNRSEALKDCKIPEYYKNAVLKADEKRGTITQYTWTVLVPGAKARIVVGSWPRNEKRHTYQPQVQDIYDTVNFETPRYQHPFSQMDTTATCKNGSSLRMSWYFPNDKTAILNEVEYRSGFLVVLPKSPVAKICEKLTGSLYDYNDDEDMVEVTQQVPWDLQKKNE
jgi:hypothetical protein